VELADDRANVELRNSDENGEIVVLAFPYDAQIVELVRAIPQRRFDWDRREWWAPTDDWAALHVADVLARFPELTASKEVDTWIRAVERRWIGTVSTRRYDGRGWWALTTRAGTVPTELLEGSVEAEDGVTLVELTQANAAIISEQRSARLDAGAARCLTELEVGRQPPPAQLELIKRVDADYLRLNVLWDLETGIAFERMPASAGTRTVPIDPWLVEQLDEFIALHEVGVTGEAGPVLRSLREEHAAAAAAVRQSKATTAEPIEGLAERLGGTLEPFQWAGVRYALEARRTLIADEQGLGKTIEALATIEADDAYPAVVVCPASIKRVWAREAERWLPHRSFAVVEGRSAVSPQADITILNYEIVAAHGEQLARRRPKALIIDESHYCKNPRAKRTQAVRRLASVIPDDGLRLALTGTPVLNHAEELIAQLRVIGRLDDFGSGAQFARRFGPDHSRSEERLHWHLRRHCFLRRVKADVLPQLPAKRRSIVPIALTNRAEYRKAETDIIAWLRDQPLDLSELDAKIAATLRAERLAQLGVLQRLAGSGKLDGALGWIHDFLASGEALVVFARHREVQQAVIERFPNAVHLVGSDSAAARQRAIDAFQEPDGPQLIICATRVAAQGITLTRASNVAFLELEWTPAMHEQAEDRCHRIGQRDAVTAWYLLAAETIDERMSRLIERKRASIAAVTDGKQVDGDSVVEAIVRELREGEPFKRLRSVA
jgi:hypothetical protein